MQADATWACALGKMFGGTVHCIDVVVAIVEEIADLFPGALLAAAILPTQRLIQRGQTFMGLPVGTVQVQKGPSQRGSV